MKESVSNDCLAPIVLFAYNRLDHTRQTIEAIQKNRLASRSDLFIYSDGARSESNQADVKAVREYLRNVSGFKNITLIERESNWGLAKSIIDGVGAVIQQYGRVIVLEDDIVTSPAFLTYMNSALDRYKNNKEVWHVSGWNYPVRLESNADAFFWRVMSCWGWATWEDRWAAFAKDPADLIQSFSWRQRRHFDLDGSGVFWSQVVNNKKGLIDTWAIFWYATIYRNKGLCLNPRISFVENIGHDGSGVHCPDIGEQISTELNANYELSFPERIEESATAVKLIKAYYKRQKKPLLVKIINKISRLLIKRNLLL